MKPLAEVQIMMLPSFTTSLSGVEFTCDHELTVFPVLGKNTETFVFFHCEGGRRLTESTDP